MLIEQIIKHSYQFLNVSSPISCIWLSWKVAEDGSSILCGLVVKIVTLELIYIHVLCNESTGCKKAGDSDVFHRSRHYDKRFIIEPVHEISNNVAF